VPEPVWQGFQRAVAVRVSERYGRTGKKLIPEVPTLIATGYVARLIDQGYGLVPDPD
jgi:hypothetical protein